ncbi:MAG: alanine racemase [Candidatus Eisenbacteria bacterium]
MDPRIGWTSWVEVEEKAIVANLASFRHRLAPGAALMAVVKSNGYGHGMEEVARIAAAHGADAFGVHTVAEAERLGRLGLGKPVIILGYTARAEAERLVASGAEATVYNVETLEALSAAASARGAVVRCHVKVETGVQRQGIFLEDLEPFLARLASLPGLALAGVSTHFANIEDTTDHSYARRQLAIFREAAERVRARAPEALRHCACSAAVLTMRETLFDMVRVGIGLYGIWPSRETLLSCRMAGEDEMPLRPALSWKARLAQVKLVPGGAYVGYGCTHRTTRPTRVGVIPIGYADGYDRGLSGIAHVLVRGRRAPVLGRICMNLFMVDVTDIEGVGLEEEVVLIGRQDGEQVTAADLASLCNTIAYEIVARIGPHLPRIVV